MAQSSQTGSTELSYNSAALPPPWQRGKTSLFANDPHTKKRKLEALNWSKTNVKKSQTNPPASQVTTHNRFSILEATEDAMDITEAVNTQHTKKTPSSRQSSLTMSLTFNQWQRQFKKKLAKNQNINWKSATTM